MIIKKAYPPNIDAIAKVFGRNNLQHAVFTYGNTVYSPSGTKLPPHLVEHEHTHVEQQTDPEAWWSRYLADPQFRLEQELEAYRAQYKFIVNNLNRAERRRLVKKISKDLASPLYGNIISSREAEELIKNE